MLTKFDEQELRAILHSYIDKHCIFRCDPDVQYAPGIPKGTLPSSAPGKYSTWQFYLRRLTQNGDFMSAVSMLLYMEFQRRNEPKEGFQVAGLETSSIPMVSFVQGHLRQHGYYFDSFTVRKDRKGYGLFNFVDGRPNQLPVMVFDDLVHSGGSIIRVLDTALYEYNLDPHPRAYCIINIHEQMRHTLFNGFPIEIVSLFDRSHFDFRYDPKKYWVPDDCQKLVNYRPNYR